MTLKQFLELALGLLLAYLFFASNLIFIIKWPLIVVSILFGAGLAFFPIEDRPLDQWIINFIKAIYMPTRFIWKKTNKIPPLFVFTSRPAEVVTTITKTIKAPGASITLKPTKDLSDFENEQINRLDTLFTQTPSPTISAEPVLQKNEDKPSKPSISIRKLNSPQAVANTTLQTPKTPITPVEKSAPPIIQDSPPKQDLNNVVFTAPSVKQPTQATPISSAKKITLPASPKLPNLITGVVVDHNDKLIENAIVQIVNSDGIPARAMKTNALGQFYTSTPLSPGTYIIEVDKDQLGFAPQQLIVNNSILSPIELRASN